MVGEAHVGLGQIGEQVGDDRWAVLTGDLDRPPTHRDSRKVLGPGRADACDVAEDERDHLGATERLGSRERLLVGDDRAVVVAHRVVHGGDGVQDVAAVDLVPGRLVDVECAKAVLQRLGEVRRLVVHDAEQVHGPCLDQLGAALARDLAGLHRQSERILRVAAEMREARQTVQRLRLADLVALRPRDDPRLQGELPCGDGIVLLSVSGTLEQILDGWGRARVSGRDRVRFHAS